MSRARDDIAAFHLLCLNLSIFFCSDGWTALHSASFRNHLEIAALLLDNGADANAMGM